MKSRIVSGREMFIVLMAQEYGFWQKLATR
jgi:hypothetical protein